MNASRPQVCRAAAEVMSRAGEELAAKRTVIGFDGFVDAIIAVVDKRQSVDHYEPVRTIAVMAEKIRCAAGESANYELVVKHRKLGGNGPIMANALARLGLGVTYLGSVGYPEIHPVFQDFAGRADVRGIVEPGHTDALEFDDGKLLLGKYESLNDLTWDNLVARVGRDALQAYFDHATLIGMTNWTMLPRMSELWEHLIVDVLPRAGAGADRRRPMLFVDLADPEKRTFADTRHALGQMTRFQEHAEVILGLNLKESVQVAAVLGLPPAVEADHEATIEPAAAAIRKALGIGCVVIHPRRAAAAATASESAWFAGPFIQQPMISTGAGDHFNAGFCLGRILGLSLEQSLCSGVACSGYYVRTAQSPTCAELAEFVRVLPDPETGG